MAVGSAVSLLLLSLLVTSSIWPAARVLLATHRQTLHAKPPAPAMSERSAQAISGALDWDDATQTTQASVSVPTTAQAGATLDPAFQAYYQKHGGTAALGTPLTPGFQTPDGWMQFFTNTALLQPAHAATATSTPAAGLGGTNDPITTLIHQGIHDSATGIVELPLLHSLLVAGSEASLLGPAGGMTYIDLRTATASQHMVIGSLDKSSADTVFVPEGIVSGKLAGHQVPTALWDFINSPSVAPDGWQVDFGVPLTEALPGTLTASNGSVHQVLIQAFWQTVLVLDQDDTDASGAPLIQRLALGHDYLATFGYPAATTTAGVKVWLNGSTVVRGAPAESGVALAHLGLNWPVTLSGAAQWVAGALWYQITWHAARDSGTGWLPASTTTSSAPPAGSNGMGQASLDALSPSLAGYLAQLNGDAGVAIYDVTRNQYYSDYGDNTYVMGSSAKIPIILTYLNWVEQQGRGLINDEDWLMQTMIENSNNDSAQTLFDTDGGDPAIISYLQSIGLGGYTSNPNGWGWATFSPGMMVRLLWKLYDGHILNGHDRSYVLNLMSNVEADQRFGVGDTAPSGASVAMKDGWLTAPDGLWAANSSGIVTSSHETYIISVYTAEQSDLNTNRSILQHVCAAVVPLLAQ
jgi:hypothetical protein